MRASLLTAPLAAVLSLAACDGIIEPGGRPQEKVLFLRYTDPARHFSSDSLDIHSVNADGTSLRNLTGHPARYGSVSVSPDGRSVVFHSDRGGTGTHVWVMNSDGSGLEQLVTGFSRNPLWSPDGTRIAFETVGSDGLLHVYVMNADGHFLRNVSQPAMQVGGTCGTTGTQSRIELVGWLPDGRVAFTRHYCGFGYRNFVVNADGTGFTETQIALRNAHFSPDGSRVVVTRLEGGSFRVVLMNADGTGARVLSTQGTHQGLPQISAFGRGHSPWSPDGKRVLFFANASGTPVEPQTCGDSALPYVVNVDGSGVRRLMDSCVYGTFDGWSRSGRQVAFTLFAASSGPSDVYTVNADGTGSVNLTRSPFWEREAEWLPRP